MSLRTFTLLLSATLALAKPTWKDLPSYSFEKYVQEFDHPWQQGTPEYETRKSIFNTELARVIAHNADKTKSWKEGINKFSALTSTELKSYKGRAKGVDLKHQPKHIQPAPLASMKPVSELPSRVDWREAQIVSPVKDQGYCGSCWAFASTAVVESHVAKETGLLFELSVEQTAFCSPNPEACGGTGGCQGATAEVAFDYHAGSGGLYQEYQYSYHGYKGTTQSCKLPTTLLPKAGITGFVKLPVNNYTALMNAVATVGPIAISVDANWGGYESGIFNGCSTSKNIDIDHAVVLVGYGEEEGQKYWLVRNSWSPSWGEKGYIRVARSDDDEKNCGTDSTPADGNACAGDDLKPVSVCGTCGILYDSSYPTGAHRV